MAMEDELAQDVPPNSWNYRVMEIDGFLGIHEVYYRNGVPISSTVNAVAVVGDDLDQLSVTLSYMAEALDKPILNTDFEIVEK